MTKLTVSEDRIVEAIITVRGQRVVLASDLAALYGVPTKRLNEQVKRNGRRFPADFMFALNREEWSALMLSQIATTSHFSRTFAA